MHRFCGDLGQQTNYRRLGVKIPYISKIVFFIIFFLTVGVFVHLNTANAVENPVKISYVEWSSEIASSYLIKAILQEKLDQECVLKLKKKR